MEKVESKKRMDVWESIVGSSIVMKNQEQYSTAAEIEAACVDHFVNIDPHSSWVRVAEEPYYHQQVAAVEEVKSYLPPRGESWCWRVLGVGSSSTVESCPHLRD